MSILAGEAVTIITMYRGHDSEMFTQVVAGYLTKEQKDRWRKAHSCDKYSPKDEDDFPSNNLFFREVNIKDANQMYDLVNVDGKAKRETVLLAERREEGDGAVKTTSYLLTRRPNGEDELNLLLNGEDLPIIQDSAEHRSIAQWAKIIKGWRDKDGNLTLVSVRDSAAREVTVGTLAGEIWALDEWYKRLGLDAARREDGDGKVI